MEKELSECTVYIGGTFDMFHYGHLNLFKKCRETFKKVIVSINTDEFAEQYKRRPSIPLNERIQMLDSCKYIDQVVVNEGGLDSTIAISKVCPDYIAHGDDWEEYSLMKQMGLTINYMVDNHIKFFFVPYTKGISTTQLTPKQSSYPPLEVVVARYDEEINWCRDFPIPCTIYTKTDLPPEEHVPNKVIKIPVDDYGREGSTWLMHIINNYDNLAGYTLFVQGRHNDHCADLMKRANFVKPFTWLADDGATTNFSGTGHSIPKLGETFTELFPLKHPPENFTFGRGGMFMVSREQIYNHPVERYKAILAFFKNSYPQDLWARYIERYWDKLFEL